MEAKIVLIDRTGGPDVMNFVRVELSPPGQDEVTIRHTAIGFNFIDISQRDGRAPLPLPSGLGHEAVGVVETVGRP